MAVSAGMPRGSVAVAVPRIPLHRRLYGFGSIYGKTVRDSRLAFIIAAGFLGGLPLVMARGARARLDGLDAQNPRPMPIE